MKTVILNCVLCVLVFSCAMAQVVVRHETRDLYAGLRLVEAERDEMIEEWSRLRLELSTWASRERIEHIARSELGLRADHERKLIVLKR